MIVIVGAGIAGLSTAFELSRRGAEVLVLEADHIASGASGVATSYLEPRLGSSPMRSIEWESLRRWPDYARKLNKQSGMDVEFRTEGQVKVTIAENHSRFEKDLATRRKDDDRFKVLTVAEARQMEPSLSPEISGAAYLPHVNWVTGAKVCEALAMAITDLGGVVRPQTPVTSIRATTNGVEIQTGGGDIIAAQKLILCTGLGQRQVSGLPADIPASRPVRGVNLILDQSGLAHPLRHMIKHHRGNMCPRAGGRLIVGTTYEAGETSMTPDDSVVEFLYGNAEPILPCVRDLPVLDVQAGLRSKIGDGNLRLGRSRDLPDVYFSLSHSGAGYLRAPVVADELAEFVLTGRKGPFCQTMLSG